MLGLFKKKDSEKKMSSDDEEILDKTIHLFKENINNCTISLKHYNDNKSYRFISYGNYTICFSNKTCTFSENGYGFLTITINNEYKGKLNELYNNINSIKCDNVSKTKEKKRKKFINFLNNI